MKYLLGAVLTSLFMPQASWGAFATESLYVDTPAVATTFAEKAGTSQQEFKAILGLQNGQRKIASEPSEAELAADFKQFRQQFLSAKTADDLQALLSKYDADNAYKALSPDTQFVVAQAAPLLALRGIVWRLRPIFESGGAFSGTKATHTAAVTMLRAVASSTKIYLPVDQWDALFAYVTEPTADFTKSMQFQNISDYQKFLTKEMLQRLVTQTNRLNALYEASNNKTLFWDNIIYYGKGSFDDGIRRYVGFGKPELGLALASSHYQLHSLYVFDAYARNNLMNFFGELGKHHGLDSYFPGELGVSSRERFGVFRKFESKGFLKLRTYVPPGKKATKDDEGNYGRTQMANAFNHLKWTLTYLSQANSLLQRRTDAKSFALNPYFVRDDIVSNSSAEVNRAKGLLEGPKPLRSPITGESVTLDVAKFYMDPPMSLISLMPVNSADAFEEGVREKKLRNKNGEELVYRNYYEGRALKWDNNIWSKYVPSAKGESPDYMIKVSRVTGMTPGARLVTWPLGEFVD